MGRMSDKPDNDQMKQATRDAAGRLLPGARLNPSGRPFGSGFRRTLETLFDFMNKPEVQTQLRAALQKEATENPYRFARQFVLPCTPHKFRKELRARIRAAEQAAFDKAQSSFIHLSETSHP